MQESRSNPISWRGLGVLVTRPAHQSEALCGLVESAGGQVIRWPVIEIQDSEDPGKAVRVIDRLGEFQLAVFVSANAVEWGLRLVRDRGQRIDHLTVVAVGQGTARSLKEQGVKDPIVPDSQSSTEGLLSLDLFQAEKMAGKRLVIFRGQGGRELLGDTLRERGALVEYAEVYQRAKPNADPAPLLAQWERGQIDVIIVTSSEGLNNLIGLMGEKGRHRLLDTPLLVISERIATLARKLGFKQPPIIAMDVTDCGLVEALKSWCERSREERLYEL